MKGKEVCVNFDPERGRCNILIELVCERKKSCTFFCTAAGQKLSDEHCLRLMQSKPEAVQSRAALLYYGGKMPWNDF